MNLSNAYRKTKANEVRFISAMACNASRCPGPRLMVSRSETCFLDFRRNLVHHSDEHFITDDDITPVK